MSIAKYKPMIVGVVAVALLGVTLAGAELDQAMTDFKAGKYAECGPVLKRLVKIDTINTGR